MYSLSIWADYFWKSLWYCHICVTRKTFTFGTTNKFSCAIISKPQIHIAIITSLYTTKLVFRQQIAIQSAIYFHTDAPQHSCLWYIYRTLQNTISHFQYLRVIIYRCFIKLRYFFLILTPRLQSTLRKLEAYWILWILHSCKIGNCLIHICISRDSMFQTKVHSGE